MSLPREWSFQAARSCSHQATTTDHVVDSFPYHQSIHLHRHQCQDDEVVDIPFGVNTMVAGASASVGGCAVGVDVETGSLQNDPQLECSTDPAGSLFSVHSAPVFELNPDSTNGATTFFVQEMVQNARSAGRIPITDCDIDDDNDNLLTISSLTARPLIAKSRELRTSKKNNNNNNNAGHKKKKKKKKSIDGTRKHIERLDPPDGGYGWAVVFGAFFVQFWVAGLVKSCGVILVEVMEAYSYSSASVVSWIPAILSALCLALAPLTSVLCQKFSCRSVVFVGGLFCATGLILSYFATRLLHLFFTFGILTGIGGGLSTTPGIVMVSQYFDKHRALANGICVSGTAAGSFVFPFLIEELCDSFGFHGTILVLGGCMLHVCVSATLYRPLTREVIVRQSQCNDGTNEESRSNSFRQSRQQDREQNAAACNQLFAGSTVQEELPPNKQLEFLFINDQNGRIGVEPKARNNLLSEIFNQNTMLVDPGKVSDTEEEKDQMGDTIFMKPICAFRSSSILHSVEDLSTDSTCVYKSRQRESLSRSMFLVPPPSSMSPPIVDVGQDEIFLPLSKPKKESLAQKIARYLDVSLLKEFSFIMMCLSVSLMSTGSPYMLYYLPAYVRTAGYSKTQAGYLVAISAALDLCGRLGLGWLSDLQLFDRKKGYIGSIVGAGVAVLVIPVADSFYVLACSVGMYGLCLGCWFLLVPVLLADQYGPDRIGSSYGLVRMFQSIGAISIPPLAGLLKDVTGGYAICFYCMGTCMVLGGVPLLLVADSSPYGADSESGKTASTGSTTDKDTR